MTSEGTFLLMAIAVLLSSLALVMSALASVGIYRTVRRLEERIEPLIPEAMAAVQKAEQTMSEALVQIRDLSERASKVLDNTESQLNEIKAVREDVTNRIMVQAERVELVLDDTLSRVQDLVHMIHNGVMRPVREVNGVVVGIKTAVQTLLLGRRPSVARATQDEEMFI